jgi:hypothetical protein
MHSSPKLVHFSFFSAEPKTRGELCRLQMSFGPLGRRSAHFHTLVDTGPIREERNAISQGPGSLRTNGPVSSAKDEPVPFSISSARGLHCKWRHKLRAGSEIPICENRALLRVGCKRGCSVERTTASAEAELTRAEQLQDLAN